MYSINNNSIYELNIKNSKFICLLYKINNYEEIDNILNKVKSKYVDATHYCYAYNINNHQKASDDGEPSNTAGKPMLNVLNNYQLTNILIVIVRYFGGIKLGANGLIRAYTKCTKEALEHNTIVNLIEGLNIEINFSYDKVKKIDYLLKEFIINKKEYLDQITYNINIPKDKLNIIIDNNINYKIIKNIVIEKIVK